MHRENNTNSAEKIKSETLGAVPVQLVDQVLPRLISVVDINGEILTSLPCLLKNNSIEASINSFSSSTELYIDALCSLLTSYHKKQAENLHLNVKRLIEKEAKSISHVAFLTLTFKENIIDHNEAYRRFRSFNTNYLAPHKIFGQWVNVKEHQVRGAWHYHMIIELSEDIKTGFNFDIYDKWLDGPRNPGTFPTGSKELRSLWVEMSEALKKYKFGKIFTLEPIKSNEEALSRYVGKYISKHINQRTEKDKGVRLINYSKGWSKNSMRFSWNNENAKEWRKKLKLFSRMIGCQEMYQITEKLGPGWPYKYMQDICNIYEVASDIITREEKVFKSPILEGVKSRKEKRENWEDKNRLENLTLHNTKSQREIRTREDRKKLSSIISPANVENWVKSIDPDEYLKMIEKNRAERIYAKTRNEKIALDRMILTREAAEEFGFEIQNNNDIEGVPF